MNITRRQNFVDTFLLVLAFFVIYNVAYDRTARDRKGIIWSDQEGYYLYLPMTFVNHSPHGLTSKSDCCPKNDKGEFFTKFTCGVAYCQAPFFLGAHFLSIINHVPATGYNDYYYSSVILAAVVWGLIGILVLRRILLKYFSRSVTWLTVISIILGTNFFHYTSRAVGMSHVYSFALVAILVLITTGLYKTPAKSYKFILLGFLSGWLVLIRPTNIVFLLFILLWDIRSINNLKARFTFYKENFPKLLLALPFSFLPIIPQMFYWKEMLGSWVSYSYGNESFIYWKHPKIAEVLFDTQNGLFLYSSILLFSLMGLSFSKKDTRTQILGFVPVFMIITYIFASWWAWWYGAAFGHRCYVEYFPIFALPMTVFYEKVMQVNSKVFKICIYLLIIGLIYYSVGMSILLDYNNYWDGKDWWWNFTAWKKLVHELYFNWDSFKHFINPA